MKSSFARGFTLIELLVVIGIIGVLVAILIPVIGRVRTQAHVADTKNQLNQLVAAIERYHGDFHAYPGPLLNDQIRLTGFPLTADAGGDAQYEVGNMYADKITGTENLVLGLLGGLRITANKIVYDPRSVGKGPINLNMANPKRYEPYADLKDTSMKVSNNKWNGYYNDGYFDADDSLIPEFVDRFPESMPLLYMRARVGAQADVSATITALNNGVANDAGLKDSHQQYDLDQIIGYTGVFTGSRGSMALQTGAWPTGTCIGQGKNPSNKLMAGAIEKAVPPLHGLRTVDVTKSMTPGAAYNYPFDAYPYLLSPTSKNAPRVKDTFILIAAGADRMYGTEDDITSFGDVQP